MIGQRILSEIKQLREEIATIYHSQHDRERRGVVAVEFPQGLVHEIDTWSAPIQIRFEHTAAGWTMHVRTLQQAYERSVSERASRQ